MNMAKECSMCGKSISRGTTVLKGKKACKSCYNDLYRALGGKKRKKSKKGK